MLDLIFRRDGSLSPIGVSLVLLVGVCLYTALHARASVNNTDAFAYIEGAISLQDGKGYVSVSGVPLNHWPVAFAWLLSFFPDPLTATYWINAASYSIVLLMLMRLGHQAGWSVTPLIGLTVALGAGFFYFIARIAMPDILAYAVFFVCIYFVLHGGLLARRFALVGLALLTLLKSIAVVFVPAIFLAELWRLGFANFWQRFIDYSLAGSALLAVIVWTFAFNYHAIGEILPSSHSAPTVELFASEVVRFVQGFFRQFLANWYGSIRSPIYLVTLMLVVIVGLFAFLSLRPTAQGRLLFESGIAILLLSWVLEFVRIYHASPRLMGYGLCLLVLGCGVSQHFARRWVLYACASLASTIACVSLVPMDAANSILYAKPLRDIQEKIPKREELYSNSLRVVDIHVKRHARPIRSWSDVDEGGAGCVVELLAPNQDAVGVHVWPLPTPPKTWSTHAENEMVRVLCRQKK
ncbi:MAG: hypothetical protein AAF732_01750 [Pseudomonadota bacterium]